MSVYKSVRVRKRECVTECMYVYERESMCMREKQDVGGQCLGSVPLENAH